MVVLGFRHSGNYVFQEKVEMPYHTAYYLIDGSESTEEGQDQIEVSHVAGPKNEHVEEVDFHVRVLSGPEVKEHKRHTVRHEL